MLRLPARGSEKSVYFKEHNEKWLQQQSPSYNCQSAKHGFDGIILAHQNTPKRLEAI